MLYLFIFIFILKFSLIQGSSPLIVFQNRRLPAAGTLTIILILLVIKATLAHFAREK